MRKRTNEKCYSFLGELHSSLLELGKVERAELDELSRDNELYELKREDEECGTHNIQILELEKQIKVYDVGIMLHPIMGFLFYKDTIKELTEKMDSLKVIDEEIRQNRPQVMQLKNAR